MTEKRYLTVMLASAIAACVAWIVYDMRLATEVQNAMGYDTFKEFYEFLKKGRAIAVNVTLSTGTVVLGRISIIAALLVIILVIGYLVKYCFRRSRRS